MSLKGNLLPVMTPMPGTGIEAQVGQMRDVLFLLMENVDGALQNLNEENFSPDYKRATDSVKEAAQKVIELSKPGEPLAQGELKSRFKKLRQAIVDNATEITLMF
ncbi:MAG: hypothetical protein GX786_07490, partial [Clostridiales bacterium]|nr:hypothetical protein [Clostridiales bacterium]